ncbi:MAG TPA: carboxypeptidase regulatory-like domain-containing protein [Bryobacteraceae bacterium]|nr:carboxypeptidase regulatory-like domain-containing protein [Bryobacteraceae bacterium]
MSISKVRLRAVNLCLLAGLSASMLLAQFESGTVLGSIHDATGAGVPNAAITLEDVQTGVTYKAKSDSNGNYEFVNEHPGTYRVRAEATGFETATAANFDLQVNARQRVDLNLKVGQASQNVTVTDAASVLETDSSSRGQVINPRQIIDLPLNGRAYADLTLLVPGVARSPLENQSDSSRDASFNINGLRSEYNDFLLDGVDNNAYGTSNQGFSNQVIQPNPDALAEFKVETDNYSAEFGRSPGAVINATLKSGTNDFHGELWEFLRNTDLNSVGFFRPVAGGKLPFNQNQFGGAFGGPILKDKMFFFADYEGFRRVYHQVLFATVPTAAELSGDFSAYNVTLKNPLTGQAIPGNKIPTSQITPFASNVFAALPVPNLPGNSNNYLTNPADTTDGDKGDFRYDYFINQKVSFFARYSQSNTNIFNPAPIPGIAGGNSNGNVFINNKQGVLGATWTVNATSVLEARLGVDYTQGGKTPTTLGASTAGLLLPNQPTDPSLAGGLLSIGLGGGLSQLGRLNSNPQYQDPFVADPKVNYTKVIGRHSLKMGFEYQLIDTAVSDFHPQYGQENFTGYFSDAVSTANLSGVQQQVYSLADFIYGAPSHYELDNNPVAHLRQRMYFGYLQDDYKVSSKFTVNLGVRYEFGTPQYERDNNLSNFDPVTQSLITATGGSLYNRSLVHPDYKNWAPRAGFAWQVGSKTVIRSGYGLAYVQFNRLGGENLLAYNGPSIVDAAVDQVPGMGICTSVESPANSCFRTTAQGFPPGFASPASFQTALSEVRYIPADFRTPYVQSWNFDVQRDLGHNLILDTAYVGNHGVGLTILADANQALPNLLGQNLSVNARRPIPNFTTIEQSFNGGFSSYNALQAKVEKRYSLGLYFINSFTWSKAIDNAPGHLENFDGDNSRVNLYDLAANKAVSSYDQPINDTLSVLYELPFGKGRHFDIHNTALDVIAGGWGVDVINTETSGLPLNITYSPTTQGSVSPLVTPTPNLTGQSLYLNNGNKVDYLNAAAFSNPSYTQPFGNAGRNIARTPFFSELDFGLHKNFNLGSEKRYIQFRAEAFNLLNKTNFAPPSTLTSNSSGFGVFTTTFPSRQIQLALKLYF